MERKVAIKLCEELFDNLPSITDERWYADICCEQLETLSFDSSFSESWEEEDFELEEFEEILSFLKKGLTQHFNKVKMCLDLIGRAEEGGK